MGPNRDTAVRRTAPHATTTCPPPFELAASLALELNEAEVLLGPAPEPHGDAEAQLRALSTPIVARADGGPELLLLDRALERGEGDPLIVAVVLAELGRRAGLP